MGSGSEKSEYQENSEGFGMPDKQRKERWCILSGVSRQQPSAENNGDFLLYLGWIFGHKDKIVPLSSFVRAFLGKRFE